MEAKSDGGLEDLPQLSNLVDPVRRRLYERVAASPVPVTREDAAGATGITRTLAAYHLDKLVDAGLIDAGYARPEGRRAGPGAGRPAKHYSRTPHELAVTLPARSYLLMADLLAAAVEADGSGAVRSVATRHARQTGRVAVEHARGTIDIALSELGFEPYQSDGGDIEMRNCPFHQLSQTHTELICSLNLNLVSGVLEGAGQPVDRAELKPREGRCCVVIHPSHPA